jgi:hypothetical protein
MRNRSAVVAAVVIGAVGVAGVAVSSGGQTQRMDRGLPAANLNNTAAGSRSNVAWSNGNDYVTGDTLVVGKAGQKWILTKIRTWSIGHLNTPFGTEFSTDALYFSTSAGTPGAIGVVERGTVGVGSNRDTNRHITHIAVTYVGGSNYESQTPGSYRQIWQNDFTDLHLPVKGGTAYYFAVDGTTSSYAWFNHASNTPLSGSQQQGSDGLYVAWAKNALNAPNTCDSIGPIRGVCSGGWDKSSDINVQAFASRVAVSKGDCAGGGWRQVVGNNGGSFRNRRECIKSERTHP